MQEEKLSAAVGRKIAALRKERGLTQKQLADKIYTSDKNISKWETGRALPDLEFLLSICAELGVKVDYFTDESVTAADILNAQRQKEVKKRIYVWVSVIAALAGMPLFVFAAARAYLPSPLPVHFNSSLGADRMGDVRELSIGAIMLFTLTAAALTSYIIYYIKRPNAQTFRTPRHIDAFGVVFLCVAVISLAVTLFSVISCANAAYDMGLQPPEAEKFPIVMAALLCCIYWLCGCAMMFVPRNEFFGFRIPSAFESNLNWRAYNSSAAAVFMLTALILSFVMMFMPRPLNEAEALAGGLAPLLPAALISYIVGKGIIKIKNNEKD